MPLVDPIGVRTTKRSGMETHRVAAHAVGLPEKLRLSDRPAETRNQHGHRYRSGSGQPWRQTTRARRLCGSPLRAEPWNVLIISKPVCDADGGRDVFPMPA